jgi:hypothetical protein
MSGKTEEIRVENEKEKNDIAKIRYPELNPIMRLYPNPEIVLGYEIFWQEKRDGSNIGVWLDENNDIKLRSKNMDNASDDFYKIFNSTEEASKIKELLLDLKTQWSAESVIFGELLIKGKSPTKTELHNKNEFIVFDIWSKKGNGFLPYMLVHQYCYQYKLPIVELYGTSQHTTIESLYAFRDRMLEIAKTKGREGTVGKTFRKNASYLYFKEKLDLPKIEKLPRLIEEGKIILPQLADSEILGALDKVLVDLGFEKFKDTKLAMPLFAQYVADECRKHNCANNIKLFPIWKTKVEELESGRR